MAEFTERPAGPPSETSVEIKSINVSDLSKGAAAAPAAPPKKGSAKESIFSDLKKKFGEAPAAAPAPAPAAKPEDGKGPNGEEDPGPDPNETPAPAAPAEKPEEKPAAPKPKPNAWKIVEEQKRKVKDLETRIAAFEKGEVPPAKAKEYEDKLAAAEKRASELDEEIKYVNYQKSSEFQEKYQKPYDDSWKRAMSDLREITISTETGERAMEASDLLELVNLPLKEAKALAEEKFGEFASDVMTHRKEIRNLYEQQSQAITEAKKAGTEKFAKQSEEQKKQWGEISTDVKKTWDEANQGAAADEKYGTHFRPVDGDQEGNQRLSKGFELADRAFSENPMAPGLKPEERKAIVARHAAVRNRAAAFGRLVYKNGLVEAENKTLREELATYKKTEPDLASGGRQSGTPAKKGSVMSGIREALVKAAK